MKNKCNGCARYINKECILVQCINHEYFVTPEKKKELSDLSQKLLNELFK